MNLEREKVVRYLKLDKITKYLNDLKWLSILIQTRKQRERGHTKSQQPLYANPVIIIYNTKSLFFKVFL
jgi:hypothetical protein